jgi:hypothetical protein
MSGGAMGGGVCVCTTGSCAAKEMINKYMRKNCFIGKLLFLKNRKDMDSVKWWDQAKQEKSMFGLPQDFPDDKHV